MMGAIVPGLLNNREADNAELDPGSAAEGPPLRHLIYFAPADIRVARVDQNCIVKFCEAVRGRGTDVTLVSVRTRILETEPTTTRTVWDVYGVGHKFDLVFVRVPVRQERTAARTSGVVMRTVRTTAYAATAVRLLWRDRRSSGLTVLYLKNYGLMPALLLAKRLRLKRTRIAFEAHVPPRSRFQRWVLKRADSVVCNGYAVRRVLLERGAVLPTRSMAIHQGFTPDTYPPGDREKARREARQKLGWAETDKVIAYTGKTYWRYAEIDLLMCAASQLAAEGIRLVVVGGRADHVQRWREEATSCGADNVSFIGFVAPSEIVDYQVAADVLVSYYPSGIDLNDYRSPGKLFEYMASGTPIVAADYASLKEVLRDGENALLIKPDAPDLLAQAVRRLMGDPVLSTRLGDQARQDAAQYSWAARAETISKFASRLEQR